MQLLSGQKRETEHKQDPAGVREHLTSSIKEKVSRLPPPHSSRCIYRVPERFRKGKEEAFTPRLVSIGPLHDRDQPHLQAMEDYKLRCLRSFFAGNEKAFAIVDFIVREEAAIRRHYDDQTKLSKLSSKVFCEMTLLDSVFMVQLLLKSFRRNFNKEKDDIFDKHWMRCDLLHDMILIENQLPLYVPQTLYSKYVGPPLADKYHFIDLVRDYFCKEGLHVSPPAGQKQPRHLLEYLRMAHIPQVEHDGDAEQSDIEAGGGRSLSRPRRRKFCNCRPSSSNLCCCCFEPKKMAHDIPQAEHNADDQLDIEAGGRKSLSSRKFGNCPPCSSNLCRRCFAPKSENKKNSPPNSAKQLQETGVEFEKGTGSCLVDIKFDKGKLTIPGLKVNELTETFFRNLIAFEQCECMSPRHISDYIIFMDRLINTYKDVDVLIKYEIFENYLNDSEEVAELFNNLYKETITERMGFHFAEISGENYLNDSQEASELSNNLYKESITERRDFYFTKISDELNDYSRDCWHRWKATWYNWKVNLKQDYFKSPWSVISVVAAFILLVLTVVQTACSVIAL